MDIARVSRDGHNEDGISPGCHIQLVAKGHEDLFLTHKPSFSFFAPGGVLTHTPFSLVPASHVFDREPDLEGPPLEVYRCTIDRVGHILKTLYLEVTFPEETWDPQTPLRATCLVDYVSLHAGGSLIERFTGEWMETRASLAIPDSKTEGFEEMVSRQRVCYVPLPFGLVSTVVSPGLSLTSAYNNADAHVLLRLRSIGIASERLKVPEESLRGTTFRLLSDQALLGVPEMQRLCLASSGLETLYLHAREQFEPYASESKTLRFVVDFNGECRRIVLIVRNSWGEPIDDCLETARLIVSGVDVFPAAPKAPETGLRVASSYWNLVAPVLRKMDRPLKSAYVFSFALSNPSEPSYSVVDMSGRDMRSPYSLQPCGSVNLSNTTNTIEVTLKENVTGVSYFHIVAECYNAVVSTDGVLATRFVN